MDNGKLYINSNDDLHEFEWTPELLAELDNAINKVRQLELNKDVENVNNKKTKC